jgi:hypothetical protein
VEQFAEVMQSIFSACNDFEGRMAALLGALNQTRAGWASAERPTSYQEAIAHLSQFADWKKTGKRSRVRERQELSKLRTYALRSWEPSPGMRLDDLEASWAELTTAEVARSRVINARIRE